MAVSIRKILDNTLSACLSVLMVILLIDVVWQVFSRYVLRDPSSYTDELARFLLIWMALLGAAYVSGQKMHLAIDLLAQKINKRWLEILVLISIALFAFIAMILGGWQLVSITLTLKQQSAALQIPLGYVYLALPVSGVSILAYTAVEMFSPNKQIT